MSVKAAQTSRNYLIFDLSLVLCLYFTRQVGQEIEKNKKHWDLYQSAYKCTETGIKVITIKNFFSIWNNHIILMKHLLKKTLSFLFICVQNPVNVFPWFSMMEEVHDLLIYGLCCNEDSLLSSYSYYWNISDHKGNYFNDY